MPSTTEATRAGALAKILRALPIDLDRIEIDLTTTEVPSYPGEPRPGSIVRLSGNGASGHGEHVGWTREAHESFRRAAKDTIPTGHTTIAEISNVCRDRLPDPYDRAALEAAAIDLALRQAVLSIPTALAVAPAPTQYVVSFAASSDPLNEIQATLGTSELLAKLDVDPEWPPGTLEALAASGRIAVLDWKRGGTPTQHEAAARILPEALLEDPGPLPCDGISAIASRRSLDGPFTTAEALRDLPPPAAANIKPARMGGVLEALDGAAFCAAHGIPVYFGGMFELGPGRRQLLALASILAPEAPNDIAPIPLTSSAPSWDALLAPQQGPGFGDFQG